MSHHKPDEDKRVDVTSQTRDDEATEVAAEELQQRIVRDRMLGLWRAAVGSVGEVVKAEHERQGVFLKPERAPDDEPRKPAPWNVRRAASDAN